MQVLYARCAGLDVHTKTVVVCVMLTELTGEVRKQVRTFATTTQSALALADWLTNQQVTHVAMESTGIYWRPIFNLLEGAFSVVLVNAQHRKAVPGRKTDVKDSEWLADLLRHGLRQQPASSLLNPSGICATWSAIANRSSRSAREK